MGCLPSNLGIPEEVGPATTKGLDGSQGSSAEIETSGVQPHIVIGVCPIIGMHFVNTNVGRSAVDMTLAIFTRISSWTPHSWKENDMVQKWRAELLHGSQDHHGKNDVG